MSQDQVTLELAYGHSKVSVAVPAANLRATLIPRHDPPIQDIPAAVRQAVAEPIGTPPLKGVVHPGETVAVVVSSWDRKWQQQYRWLPTLLNEINACGVPDVQIKVVLATGTLWPHSEQDILEIVGEEVRRRVQVIDHDSRDNFNMVYLGNTPTRGIEVWVNRHVAQADRKILTGGLIHIDGVGFGGGRKSILPGVSSLHTVETNHRLARLPGHGDALGQTAGNYLHEDMLETAALLKPDFLLNLAVDADWNIVRFYAGHYVKSWEEGCQYVAERNAFELAEPADIVITSGGGDPLDRNVLLHQKVYRNAIKACKPGGTVIVVARCQEGLGGPEFTRWFDLPFEEHERVVLSNTLRDTIMPGVAFRPRRIFQEYRVVLVSEMDEALARKAGLISAKTAEEALAYALAQEGPKASILALPNSHITFCRVAAKVPVARSSSMSW